MPKGARYDESGQNKFRYHLGLCSEPDLASFLSEKNRITPTFRLLSE